MVERVVIVPAMAGCATAATSSRTKMILFIVRFLSSLQRVFPKEDSNALTIAMQTGCQAANQGVRSGPFPTESYS
jgi:hypothetical protein